LLHIIAGITGSCIWWSCAFSPISGQTIFVMFLAKSRAITQLHGVYARGPFGLRQHRGIWESEIGSRHRGVSLRLQQFSRRHKSSRELRTRGRSCKAETVLFQIEDGLSQCSEGHDLLARSRISSLTSKARRAAFACPMRLAFSSPRPDCRRRLRFQAGAARRIVQRLARGSDLRSRPSRLPRPGRPREERRRRRIGLDNPQIHTEESRIS